MTVRLRALATGMALAMAAGIAPSAHADGQEDPELRGVIAAALQASECFEDKYEREVWFAYMDPRLSRYVEDSQERAQILQHVHCESRRLDLPPELLLAVMDVESRFDRYAVSSAGAVGLMQIMPFWPNQLGMGNEQLIRIPENVRMGATILGYYLRKERGNYQRALQRYNGSLGRSTYSDLVLDRLVSRWRYSL